MVTRKGQAFVLSAVGLLFLLGGITPAANVAQGEFSDSFRERTLNRQKWAVEPFDSHGQVTPTEAGLELTFTRTNTADFFAHTVWLKCRISGDFDARISYKLNTWSRRSGINLGLGVHPDPKPFGSTTLHGIFDDPTGLRTVISERVSLGRDNMFGYRPGEFYLSEMSGQVGRPFTTTHRDGQLRLKRDGFRYKAMYWDPEGDLWVPSGQWTINPEIVAEEDVWVVIQLWGRNETPPIKLRVRDFSLTADSLGCQEQ